MSVVAALVATVAFLLAWPPPARLRGVTGGVRSAGVSRALPLLATGAAAALLVHLVHGTRLVAALVGLVVAVGIQRLVVRARRARAAERLADLLLIACEGIAADLRAGQSPEDALARAADHWPDLATAATAATLGGDVPAALRDLATRPGAGALRLVAAAWQVSHRSGSGLAAALAQVVETLRERRRTSRMVASELASARATAHLMAALPVGVLALANGVGGDPVGFLLDTPVGLGCLALGAALVLAGLFWLQHISDGVLAR